MSEAAAETTKQPDPMEQFREMRDSYLDIWSKSSIETVNSEGYAKFSGAMLDSYLTVAAPLKEPVEQAMLKILQQLNMPTSADIAGLSGRFTNIEMGLDNMDAKLDRIEKLIAGLTTAASEKPKMPAEPATQVAPIRQVVPMSAKAPRHAVAPRAVKNRAQAEQTAKPVRQSTRKGTR